jgi:hypothetical protein
VDEFVERQLRGEDRDERFVRDTEREPAISGAPSPT